MIRKTLVPALCLVLTAACSALPQSAADAVTNALPVTETSTGATRRFAQLSDSGVPVLQVAIVGAGVSPLVLRDSIRDGIATWISVDGATITLQDGFLRGTRGLGTDVLATDVASSHAAVLGSQTDAAIREHSFLTGNDQAALMTFRCMISNEGPKTIPIAGSPTNTRLMQESCVGDGQEFVNFYWVRLRDNRVVQSTQWASPDLGRVSMRLVSE